MTNGHTNGITNGLSNGHTNGIANGEANGITNGATNGTTNGHSNGLTNGYHRATDSGIDLDFVQNELARGARLFVLSSYDQDGVMRVRDSYKEYLTTRTKRHQEVDDEAQFLKDLSFTLSSKRTRHAWRSFCLAKSRAELLDALSGLPPPVRAKTEPRLAFVFTGQGAQWPKMGMELMSYPVFQQSLLAADKYLNGLGCSWSLTCEFRIHTPI